MIFLLLTLVFIPLFTIFPSYGFSSLNTAVLYAHTIPEYPDIDSPQDWHNPSYTGLYKKLTPGWFEKILRKFHIKKPLWCPKQFSKILHEYTATIQKERFREFVIGTAFSPEHPLELYCFGSVHGSFHSLIRCLKNLKDKNVINDSFEIIKPATHIIFLGSAIDQGPYSLEVLSLIFTLQQKNPHHVAYLRGEHEEKLQWYKHSLYQEIELRSGNMKKYLIDDVQTYFESKSQAVYITDVLEPRNILCLKADAMTQGNELWEDFLQDFFNQLKPQKINTVYVYDTPRKERLIFPRVIVEARNEWNTSKPTLPLQITYEEKPLVTIFSVASCPSRPFRHLYRLFYDAYTHIRLDSKLALSTLTAYSRDIRSNDNTFTSQKYNLETGQEIAY